MDGASCAGRFAQRVAAHIEGQCRVARPAPDWVLTPEQQVVAPGNSAMVTGKSSHNDLFGKLQLCRCLAMVSLLALIAQGCTKKPESYPLTSFRVDYRTWNCQQLADEADLLKDALAVASEQRADDTAAHLKAETEAVRNARTLKKCSA